MLKNRWTFLKGFNSNLPTVSRPSPHQVLFYNNFLFSLIKPWTEVWAAFVLKLSFHLWAPSAVLLWPNPLHCRDSESEPRWLQITGTWEPKKMFCPPRGLRGWVLLCLPPPSLSHILVFLLNPICAPVGILKGHREWRKEQESSRRLQTQENNRFLSALCCHRLAVEHGSGRFKP